MKWINNFFRWLFHKSRNKCRKIRMLSQSCYLRNERIQNNPEEYKSVSFWTPDVTLGHKIAEMIDAV